MLRITEETGQPVRTADGVRLGNVLDLTVLLQASPRLVHRLVVGRGSVPTHLVDWNAVDTFEHSFVQLGGTCPPRLERGAPLPLAEDEFLLRRDVLDTQVVDCVDHRIERVADVLLTRTGGEHLEVVAVDVGFGTVLRRLGLERLGHRFPEQAIDWTSLHLTSWRGHQVQLAAPEPAAAVRRMGTLELADLLARLSTRNATRLLEVVDTEHAAAGLAAAQPEVRTRLALALEEPQAEKVLGALPDASAEPLRRLRHDRTVRQLFLRHRGGRRWVPPRRRHLRLDP